MTVAKALSSAYLPISATLMSQKIYDVLRDGGDKYGMFGTGYTYGGHPASAAVALETLKIYEERDIVDHVREVSPTFLAELEACRDHPLVGDVRGVGLIAGAELMADKASKTPFPPERKAGPIVEKACLENGLIVRAIGDRIAFTPPLIISDKEIVELFRRFRIGLDTAYERMTASQAA